MRTIKYDKLIRDKILEVIRAKGVEPKFRIASDDEYWGKLKEKLQEEVSEFLESGEVEEIADILEVIDAICEYKDINMNELTALKKNKSDQRGAFKKRIILEEA